MKRIQVLAILLCALFYVATASIRVIVVDEYDNSPIIGATVIGKSGMILGITDEKGLISVSSMHNFPITIRYIGYSPVTTAETDTVKLNVSAYQLNEVTINPAHRPIKRVLCFAREYSSGIAGSDTMQYYCEYMAEAFIAEKKVKGFRSYDTKPTVKGYKRYAKIVKNGNDSIFRPKYNDDITELSWFDFMAFIPSEKSEFPEAIKNGESSDTVFGKYGPQFVFTKKNNLFTKTADALSNHKNRKWSPFIFKLIGMTVDIDEATWALTFSDNGSNSFGVHDFINGTYNIHLTGKGRWIKKIFNTSHPIEISSYLELYPVETTNCTVDEYKELREDFNRLPFQYPAGLSPLSPAVEKLIEKVESRQP